MADPNIITAPEDFTDASWTQQDATVTPNDAVAPDGTLTADLIVPNAISKTVHGIWDLVPVVSGNNYAGSVYVEPAGYDHYIFEFAGGPFAGTVSILFDLTNMVVLDTDNGTVAAVQSSGIDTSGGLIRPWAIADAQSTGNSQFRHGPVAGSVTSLRNASDGYNSYTPDGSSGAHSWGAKFEITDVSAYTSVGGTLIPVVASGGSPNMGLGFGKIGRMGA